VQHADAEDLVQETLAVVAAQLKRFEHNHRLGAFRCWLRRTLVNQLRVLRRSQKVRSTTLANSAHLLSLAEALEDPKGSLARIWEHDHDRYVVRKLLERIEPDFQPSTWQAFRLAVLQGTEPEQVAAELGISVDSVYAAKSRVLKRLRQEAEGLLD